MTPVEFKDCFDGFCDSQRAVGGKVKAQPMELKESEELEAQIKEIRKAKGKT